MLSTVAFERYAKDNKDASFKELILKFIKLYTGEDNKSHFAEMDSGPATLHELGYHSKTFPATGLIFRDFEIGTVFSWHNAPQPQYIVYLEGEIEIETGRERRIFVPGEVLFATDLTGEGHITRTLRKGRALIITTR